MLDHLTTHRRRRWNPAQGKTKPPSPRDLEIYKRVRVWGHLQWEVAADLSVHYSRISQIVKRVERWLAAGGSPTDPQLTSALAERKLSRSLQKLRLLRAVELASAALHAEPRPITKTRRRIVGSTEVWREESETPAPPIDLYALQNYSAAVKALHAFEQSEEKQPQPQKHSLPDTLCALADFLCRLRSDADAAGRVARTPDTFGLVVTTLQNLLGPDLVPSRSSPQQASAQVPLNLSATSETPAATNREQRITSIDQKKSKASQGPQT